MKFLDKYHDLVHSDENFWFKVLVLGWMNFFTFVMAGLVYFIPIDLTWRIIGQFPAIILGALCLYVYSTVFAVLLVVSSQK